MELANIIFILSLVHLSAQREVSKVAGFIVVRHIDSRIEYLMLKSSKPHGLWSPPKGHIEDNENTFETALREIKEETDFDPYDFEIYLDEYQQIDFLSYRGNAKRLYCWLAKLKDSQKVPKLSAEHVEYRWFTKEEIESMAVTVFPEFVNLIEKFDTKKIV